VSHINKQIILESWEDITVLANERQSVACTLTRKSLEHSRIQRPRPGHTPRLPATLGKVHEKKYSDMDSLQIVQREDTLLIFISAKNVANK